MPLRLFSCAVALSCMASAQSNKAHQRTRDVIRYGGVAIETIEEGQGPAIVLLPSLGRDSEEFDPVAERLAAAGFHVLRPQPRRPQLRPDAEHHST